MKGSTLKKIVFLILLALVISSCAAPGPLPPRHRPRRPYPGAVWVPGHRAPAGRWISGHWR